jgi:hypothetical protein
VAGEVLKNFTRINQFRRCPGGGDVVAPDKSNLLSPQLQNQLDCTEADRGAGNFTAGG